jgi:hypothetical protein
MPANLEIKVEGLKELNDQLVKLANTGGKKALDQALVSASGKVKRAAKDRAPGTIKKAVFSSKLVRGVSVLAGDTASQLTIGVHSNGSRAAPHAHLMEYGTKQRLTDVPRRRQKALNTYIGVLRGKRTKRVIKIKGEYLSVGRKRGRVKPVLFMNKAWKQHGGEKFVHRFKKSLSKKIDRLTQ